MRMPLRIAGLLIVLIVLVAAITITVTQLIQSRSGDRSEPAVRLIEPVTKDISAERGWQNTGVRLGSGETLHIQFIAGEIYDGDTVIRGPAGSGYICGDAGSCEPIPGAQRVALIGRVEDHIFLIGDKNTIEVQENGELQLRINDCDAGLFDNSGSLTVKISP
jgi:hypothetical protein